MATGKYQQWLKPDGIDRIVNWAAKGCTYAEIANNMGISEGTLYGWLNAHDEINEAIKRGRSMSIVSIENMAFRMAMGDVEEEVVVKVRDSDGSERVEMRKRRPLPSVPMLIFLLKNRAGYRDNPDIDPNADESLRKAREILAGVPSAID